MKDFGLTGKDAMNKSISTPKMDLKITTARHRPKLLSPTIKNVQKVTPRPSRVQRIRKINNPLS
jgi:hypothetical protein